MTAVVGGALLVGASARRAERAAERSIHDGVTRELLRYRILWRRRAEHLTAFGSGALGIGVLVYAYRRQRRASTGGAPSTTATHAAADATGAGATQPAV